MGARVKLNAAYFGGIGILSGFLGLASGSVVVFLICFGLLAAVYMHDGAIRLKPTRR